MRTRQLLSLVGAWTLLASVPSPVLAQNIIFDSVSVTNPDDLTVMIEVDGNGFIRRSRAFNVKIGGEVQTENCTVLSNVLFNCQVMAEDYPPGEYVMSAWHGRASRLNQKVLSITSFTISAGDVAPDLFKIIEETNKRLEERIAQISTVNEAQGMDITNLQTALAATNATCENTPGGFSCSCNAGYTLDGTTCTDIDECARGANNCGTNATCGNTEGSFTCDCNEGYSGDGTTCTDIDECTRGVNNCGTNATCGNTEGSFTCDCNEGFTGDGVLCEVSEFLVEEMLPLETIDIQRLPIGRDGGTAAP